MRKRMHHIAAATSIFMVLFLLFYLSVCVFAESGDGFSLDASGNVTLLSEHAAKEGVSSLQFSLVVDAPATAQVAFEFAGSNASVCEYTYHAESGMLHVYMAGRNALFAEDAGSLSLGRIHVTDPGGSTEPVTVSVAGDSLKYVYGSDLKTMEGVELPEQVLLGSLTPEPTQTPRPSDSPGPSQSQGNDGNEGNGNHESNGGILSPTATPMPTRVPQQGGNNHGGGSLAGTGQPGETDPGTQTQPGETQGEVPPAGEDSPVPTPGTEESLFPAGGEDLFPTGRTEGFTKPDKVETAALVVMGAVGAEFTFTGVMLKKIRKPGRKRYRRTVSGYSHNRTRYTKGYYSQPRYK